MFHLGTFTFAAYTRRQDMGRAVDVGWTHFQVGAVQTAADGVGQRRPNELSRGLCYSIITTPPRLPVKLVMADDWIFEFPVMVIMFATIVVAVAVELAPPV
jgi:hypothetical protein